MTTPAATPKRRGCLFYGCLTLIILSLVGASLLFLGYRYALKTVAQFKEQYTEATPAQIESVEVPADQLKSLQERVARFASALDKQQQEELVLSADDINALIGSDPSFKDARIKDNLITAALPPKSVVVLEIK